jgi:Tfp pilus assembly PilM family ATPase
MARFLILDGSQPCYYLLAGKWRRGQVQLEQALTWEENTPLTPASAPALGERLREHLRRSGLRPAPLLAALGREQVIFKLLRYPRTEAAEEPAVLRFQMSRELTEPVENFVLDYVRLGEGTASGEQRALVVAVRRPVVEAWQAVARAAGLKLLALVPRAFALARCLPGEDPDGSATAFLVCGRTWAEFGVARQGQLLYARSLPPGSGSSLEEVRRQLALYAGQPQALPVRALYVQADAEPACAALQEALAIPVQRLEPFAALSAGAATPAEAAGYAAAAALLRLAGQPDQLPINFLAPKEPRPAGPSPQRRRLRLAGLAAAGFLLLLLLSQLLLANQRQRLRALQEELEDRDTVLKKLQPDKQRYEELRDWFRTAVPVLDELYELAARFPLREGLRVASLEFLPIPGNQKQPGLRPPAGRPANHPALDYTVRLVVVGTVPEGKSDLVQKLLDALNQDPYCRAERVKTNPGGKSTGKGPVAEQFIIYIDAAPRPPAAYTAQLVAPPSGFFGGWGGGGPPWGGGPPPWGGGPPPWDNGQGGPAGGGKTP